MIALFDSGNSRLHCSRWDGEKVIDPVSIQYPDNTDGLDGIIADFFRDKSVSKTCACSVSSRWREPLFQTLASNASGKLAVARTARDTGVTVAYDRPETIGVDRVLSALAAYQRFNDPCVVIDAGTAVTVDAVSGDGVLLGGFVFPGLKLLAETLPEHTDLPYVEPAVVCDGIGGSTGECISRALTLGFSAAVTELVKHASEAADGTKKIAVTGGGAEKVLQCLRIPAVYRPYLVLEGLGYAIDSLPEYIQQAELDDET